MNVEFGFDKILQIFIFLNITEISIFSNIKVMKTKDSFILDAVCIFSFQNNEALILNYSCKLISYTVFPGIPSSE